jgi:formylglycine-generating enzyme required for sulfatase activity
VRLAPFLLAKYELTQAQWMRVEGTNPARYHPDQKFLAQRHTLLFPVEQVDWHGADRVARKFGLRLPSEAEWEYAARGGTDTPWWSGADERTLAPDKENLADKAAIDNGETWNEFSEWMDDGYVGTAPVNAGAPNPFGLHQVLGNVAEWSADAFRPLEAVGSADGGGAPGDGPASDASSRVVRGGSFILAARWARVGVRQAYAPGINGYLLGARPALALEGDGAR